MAKFSVQTELNSAVAGAESSPKLSLNALERRTGLVPLPTQLRVIDRLWTEWFVWVVDVVVEPETGDRAGSVIPYVTFASAVGSVAKRLGQPVRRAVDRALSERVAHLIVFALKLGDRVLDPVAFGADLVWIAKLALQPSPVSDRGRPARGRPSRSRFAGTRARPRLGRATRPNRRAGCLRAASRCSCSARDALSSRGLLASSSSNRASGLRRQRTERDLQPTDLLAQLDQPLRLGAGLGRLGPARRRPLDARHRRPARCDGERRDRPRAPPAGSWSTARSSSSRTSIRRAARAMTRRPAPIGRRPSGACSARAARWRSVSAIRSRVAAPGSRQRAVAPSRGQVLRRCDDDRPLDGAALHPMAREAVGVLDVVGDVAGRQLAHRAAVGLEHDLRAIDVTDRSAGPVVDARRARRCRGRSRDPQPRLGVPPYELLRAELARLARCARASSFSRARVSLSRAIITA